MKLLIVTQKVDRNDPILGFFHRWIEEFAKHCEQVTVICLSKGEYQLPNNVRVLSLGKEAGVGKFKYLWRFYKYIWQERNQYDVVFVHMNQEYVLLGWAVWRLLDKKIWLWRNHKMGSWLTGMAVRMSDRVFCTSPHSFTARFQKTELMPVGIDTDFFAPDPAITRRPNSVLFLGRIAPVKNVDIFIEALNLLHQSGVDFSATIAGPVLPQDEAYLQSLKDRVVKYSLANKVEWIGVVSPQEARRLYCGYELYVNLTPSGSMDKTIFEAIACGATPIVANQDVAKLLNAEVATVDLDPVQVSEEIKNTFGYTSTALRNEVIFADSIRHLIEKLLSPHE